MTTASAALERNPAARDTIALERAIPELTGKLPRAGCTQLPTRVQGLERLGAAIGVLDLWIKRDDASGPLYGGNKPRKLDFILGDAMARGKRTVMTFGGIGTNHGLATAIYARAHGLRAILLLLQQPLTEKVRQGLRLSYAYGAEMHYAQTLPGIVLKGLRVCARELAHGELPYIIPAGGSSAAGTLGYVNAAFELKEQVDAGALPMPGWIFVPVGTAGTLAGLVLGCRLAGLPTRVAGILVTDILPPTPARTARLATRAYTRLRQRAPALPSLTVAAGDVSIVTGFAGPAYGMPTAAGRAMRDQIEQLEGIHAETTYTAKCLVALQALGTQPPYRDAPILYWHTFNSIDAMSAIGALPDYHALPPELHQFFAGQPVDD